MLFSPSSSKQCHRKSPERRAAESKKTIQKLSATDSRRYEGRYVDKAFHITFSHCGPCCDLSCHEMVSILHCALSQPSISPFCSWQQEHAGLVAMERTSVLFLCRASLGLKTTQTQTVGPRFVSRAKNIGVKTCRKAVAYSCEIVFILKTAVDENVNWLTEARVCFRECACAKCLPRLSYIYAASGLIMI